MLPKVDNNALRERMKSLVEQPKKENGKFKRDERLYNNHINKYFKDTKEKNYNAIIRWLPAAEGEASMFIQGLKHSFKQNGIFFAVKCVRYHDNTLPCPVCEYVSQNWKTWDDEQRKPMKRKSYYTSSIYIVKDKQYPELEGKVMLYEYSKDIFKKWWNKYSPSDIEETPVEIFDYEMGRNFKLKIETNGKFWNYDMSEFDDASKLCGGDEAKVNAVHKSIFSLDSYVEQIKKDNDYEKTANRLKYVLNPPKKNEDDIDADIPGDESNDSPGSMKTVDSMEDAVVAGTSVGSGVDDMSFLESM